MLGETRIFWKPQLALTFESIPDRPPVETFPQLREALNKLLFIVFFYFIPVKWIPVDKHFSGNCSLRTNIGITDSV